MPLSLLSGEVTEWQITTRIYMDEASNNVTAMYLLSRRYQVETLDALTTSRKFGKNSPMIRGL
jgi:hypothetical protein